MLKIVQVIFIATVTVIQVGNCRRTGECFWVDRSDGSSPGRTLSGKKQNWRWGLRHNTGGTEKALVSIAKITANCEKVFLPDNPAPNTCSLLACRFAQVVPGFPFG